MGELEVSNEREVAGSNPADCGVPLVARVARCDTAIVRLFENHPPGRVLIMLIAGVGTYIFGLFFAAAFVLGVCIALAARWLDNYGLESEDN